MSHVVAFVQRSIRMDKCWFCGKSIAADSDDLSWGDELCWKCGNIPTPGMDWKWEMYHPYDYLQEEYEEEG